MASESSVMAVIRASRPSFRNPHDKLAFAVHASFVAAGFSLVAAGKAALSDNPSTNGDEVGIDGWNELDDAYGFVYTKADKDLKRVALVKCLPIGDLLAVDVLDLNEPQKEPLNLQMNVKDYLSDAAEGNRNYAEVYKNFGGLVNSLNTGFLEKLETTTASSSSAQSAKVSEHSNVIGHSVPSSTVPDPLEPHPLNIIYPPLPVYGSSDLYPGPGAGFYPERGPGIGGGMLVGPHDPRFFGSGGGQPDYPGGTLGIPPGARFDPIGPPSVPGFDPSRFLRRPQRPGGDTHPDLQHFPRHDYI